MQQAQSGSKPSKWNLIAILNTNPFISAVIASLIPTALIAFVGLAILPYRITNLEDDISRLNDTVDEIDKRYTEFEMRLSVVEKVNLTDDKRNASFSIEYS